MKSAREIFSVFSQQSDDKGITLTWSSKDSISEALKALEAEIDRIIGEDKTPHPEEELGIFSNIYLSGDEEAQNELKAEQRQRLREFLGGQQ
jgi:hypothetical protein